MSVLEPEVLRLIHPVLDHGLIDARSAV